MDRNIPRKQIRARRLRRLAIGTGIAFAVVLALCAALRLGSRGIDASDFESATVDRGEVEATVSASGTVVPSAQIVVSSPISSRILEVLHRPGDFVEAGTPLMTLDLEEVQAASANLADRLAMKELELRQMEARDRTELSRLEMEIEVARIRERSLEVELANELRLDSIGTGTGYRVREARLALRTGQLTLSQLQTQLTNESAARSAAADAIRLEIEIMRKDLAISRRTLDDAYIRAPRTATVTGIEDRVGLQVTPGQQLATVADLGHYRVDAAASDIYSRIIVPGNRVSVRLGNTVLDGVVGSVAPASHSGQLDFAVTLADDSASVLRPGLRPEVFLHRGAAGQVLRIPQAPWYTRPGTYDIYVVDGSELRRRTVELGEAGYDYISVTSGLQPGERVVLSDMSRFGNENIIRIRQ